MCTDTGNSNWKVNGFDVNYASNGWGLSSVSQPSGAGTFPLIITRQTLEGLYQLKQTFTPNWSERGIDVKIELMNLSGSVIPSIRVTRSADIDAAGVSSPNVFQVTNDSTLGMGVSVNPKNLRCQMLTNIRKLA